MYHRRVVHGFFLRTEENKIHFHLRKLTGKMTFRGWKLYKFPILSGSIY